MRERVRFIVYATLALFASVSVAYAADQSFANQFLGNPLLILAVFLIIDLIAVVYRKIRK